MKTSSSALQRALKYSRSLSRSNMSLGFAAALSAYRRQVFLPFVRDGWRDWQAAVRLWGSAHISHTCLRHQAPDLIV